MRLQFTDASGQWEQLPVTGDSEGADIEVQVFEVDGELDMYVRCLCHACFEVERVGAREAMGELAEKPGVYYMEAWSVVYPSTPSHGEEYDGGIRIHVKGDE